MFTDRRDAGRRLAARLEHLRDRDPVVLALPRGGVPVAYEVARALAAPLDLVMVRKIGAPRQPELAVAAVVDGDQPEIVENGDIMGQLGLDRAWVESAARAELHEIDRRRAHYLKGRSPLPVRGRAAILVDDGIATGASFEAALRATRRREPGHLVMAVPVAPPETVERLRAQVDEAVCLDTPAGFGAVGAFYRDFSQTSDEEVVDLLARADRDLAAPGR
ncbi:MAG: phosphoribosyltransferase [Myxococcota bacterium]|nr:phosphoribosyltransferase [Myxococcota bacterium]